MGVAAVGANSATTGDALFTRILVGIDDTPESLFAAAQARKLCLPDGRLELLACAETYLAAHAGTAARTAAQHLEAGTSTVLEQASALANPDESHLVTGRLAERLRAECARTGATLIALGARPHRRLAARTFNSHEYEVLHKEACSLLIARAGWGPSTPRRIVVGVDPSDDGAAAEAAARRLAHRLGCELVPVIGLGDGEISPELLRSEREDALLDPRDLAHAVVAASSSDSLVFIGRRNSRDHRFSGSISERVVFSARCSVLVVHHETPTSG
jgi:nucleotide-binding universal stress UspA family protein